MALPKIQQPLFELTVPSTKQKVTYRPFTVKEEKVLLLAQESKDIEQIVLAIKQIINNCVQNIDVDKMATFDLEYVLINLRARSVNNQVDFRIKDKDTEEEIDISIDIDDIEVVENPSHSQVLKLTDDITIKMRYPLIDQIRHLSGVDESNQSEALFNMMVDCIETVVQGEEVYKLSDFTKEEVDEFIDSFTSEHINKVKGFFDTMPVLRYETKYKTKDGTEKTFVAQGTETFFI